MVEWFMSKVVNNSTTQRLDYSTSRGPIVTNNEHHEML